jgi:hypothetical protein
MNRFFQLSIIVGCLYCLQGYADQHKIDLLESAIKDKEAEIYSEHDQESKLQKRIDEITADITPIFNDAVSIAKQLDQIRSSHEIIAPCIMNDLGTKGVLSAVFGETEAEQTAGKFVAFICITASMHEDYSRVKYEITKLTNNLNEDVGKLVEPINLKRKLSTELKAINDNPRTPVLQREINKLKEDLACENSFFCRRK